MLLSEDAAVQLQPLSVVLGGRDGSGSASPWFFFCLHLIGVTRMYVEHQAFLQDKAGVGHIGCEHSQELGHPSRRRVSSQGSAFHLHTGLI